MRLLWAAFTILATLGSLYPFNFQLPVPGSGVLDRFIESCCTMPGRGDLLGNVILFIPYGFTGLFALSPNGSARRRLLIVLVSGTVVAFVLQLLQFFLPTRDENLQDVLWNALGIVVGAALAAMLGRKFTAGKSLGAEASMVPLTLVATWLAYRLLPFVPSVDWQLIKNSLKPLSQWQVSTGDVASDLAGWLVVGYLLTCARPGARLDRHLPAIIAVVFSLEVLIVSNSINWSNLVAASLAVPLWMFLFRTLKRPELPLVALLLAVLVLTNVFPLVLRADAASFNWLPFSGFLRGSMYVNTASAAEKVFMYGSIAFLFRRASGHWYVGMAVGVVVISLIEVLQTRIVGHTPEVTDPLLVVLAGLALIALERDARGPTTGQLAAGGSPAGRQLLKTPPRSRRRRRGGWSTHTVNLRADQFEFLQQLSSELGVSVSAAVRKIVDQFVDRTDATKGGARRFWDDTLEEIQSANRVPRSQDAWVACRVNYRSDQADVLRQLSRATGTSVSRVTRRLVSAFVANLDEA